MPLNHELESQLGSARGWEGGLAPAVLPATANLTKTWTTLLLPKLGLARGLHRTLFIRIRNRQLRSCPVGILQFVKFPVKTVVGKQLLMGALLSYFAVMKHDDLIGALNG